MFTQLAVITAVGCLIFPKAHGQQQNDQEPTATAKLLTVAETSDFQSTATYADVMDYCEALQKAHSTVNLSLMGHTTEKRDIPLLILADPPIANAVEAAKDDRPVVFVMANIHAGEVCGKEASLILARKMVQQNSPLLKKIILVIAPIYNADGNERFSTTNRPGQVGPVNGMGQRPNAMGLDLNRDHMKLESPEARCLAEFMNEWSPIIAMDLHTTDGSFHRFGLTYDSPRHPATDRALLRFGRDTFLPNVSAKLRKQHQLETFFYGNFDRNHSNWLSYPAAPRYSTHYFGLRNCLGILSEAYAYLSFRDRVIATEQFVLAVLHEASENLSQIEQLVLQAAQKHETSDRIAIRARETALPGTFTVPGWKEDVAGRGRPFSGSDEPVEYTVQYHGNTSVTLDVRRPKAYLISVEHEEAIANLRRHGISFQVRENPTTETVTEYSIVDFQQAEREFQGHRLVSSVEVKSESVERSFAAGTVLVPTNQPLSALLVNLLEPQAADGLTAWNFFDDSLTAGTYPVWRVEHSMKIKE